MLLNGLTAGISSLFYPFLALMGWQHDPSRMQIYAAVIASHMVAPALMAFLVLRVTRLGSWLAPTRLALGCLLVADVLLVGAALSGFLPASSNAFPFMASLLAAVTKPAMLAALSVGLATLLASTVWHRLLKDKVRATGWCTSLLREI
jgi:hypothetical protein